MTAPQDAPDRAALAAEAEALEAAIRRLGMPDTAPDARADAGARAELEHRVLRLCAAAQALPGAEARTLADPLARLVAALDEAAARLRTAGAGGGDSGTDAGAARRAAAAYGSAAGRRRRGF